jgi:hypothetical protein
LIASAKLLLTEALVLEIAMVSRVGKQATDLFLSMEVWAVESFNCWFCLGLVARDAPPETIQSICMRRILPPHRACSNNSAADAGVQTVTF